MSSTVYHDKKPQFGFGTEDRVWPDDFDVIATVQSEDPDIVYEATNTIDHPWWDNEIATCLKPGGARSTSVGDVVVNSKDEVFIVLPVGWKKIGTADNKIVIHPNME